MLFHEITSLIYIRNKSHLFTELPTESVDKSVNNPVEEKLITFYAYYFGDKSKNSHNIIPFKYNLLCREKR